jgi:hypothetical protein
MSYYKDIANIAEKIKSAADDLEGLRRHRKEWTKPKGTTFWIGHHQYVTREDGTTPAHLEGVKREALKAFDDLIFAKQGELEGLRFKLVNLAKQGSAA